MRMPDRRPSGRFRLAPLFGALTFVLGAAPVLGATFNVTTSSSLDSAIRNVNASCSGTGDIIEFQSTPFTVSVSSPLPRVTCPNVTINGNGSTIEWSSFGFPNAGVGCGGIDGTAATGLAVNNLNAANFKDWGYGVVYPFCGVMAITGGKSSNNEKGAFLEAGSSIKGAEFFQNTYGVYLNGNATIGGSTAAERNLIYNNTTGVYLSAGGSVLGNYIGTSTGTTAAGNVTGISGTGAATITGNVVSGNTGDGVDLFNATGATISNNRIGTSADGASALANLGYGLSLATTTSATVSANVLSGNGNGGLYLQGGSGITVTGNHIGVDALGAAGIANPIGIDAYCGSGLQISNNVVSGNGGSGAIRLQGVSSSTVQLNKVGTTVDGTSARANNGAGVMIGSTFCSDFLTAASNITLSRNTVAHNQGDGVLIQSGTGHRTGENSIHSNRDKNINLDFAGGPLPNDLLDPDTGPNNRQNYPEITQAYHSAGATTIEFQLKSAAASTFTVDFYTNDPTAGAKPAGQTRLAGSPFTVTTDATGTYSGSVSIAGTFDYLSALATDSAGNSSEFSPIARAVAGPNASISPSTVSFGSIPVGATSATSTITVLSTGVLPYQISSLVSSSTASCTGTAICTGGDFACSTTCVTGTNYATGQSCTITASFSPNSVGAQSASLYLCDNSGVGPRAIALSATGIVPTVSPGTFDFGSVPVGSSAPTKTFVLANSGVVAAPLGTIAATGDFAITATTCGPSLAAGGTCSFDVRFAPTAGGVRTGQAGTSASFATVQGTGTLNADFTVPSTLDLGAFLIGSPSPVSQAISITNTGNTGLVLGPFAITAPFQYANGCPATLAPAATCTLTVSFTTTTTGTFNGTFTISSNATGGDRSVALTAQADIARIPAASIVPGSLDFGSVAVGESSGAGTVTITSNGTAPYQITSLVTSATPSCTGALPCAGSAFACTTTCSTAASYSPGASCQISATFQPTTAGSHATTIYVCDNASTTPRAITLSGSAALQPVTISPTAAEFGAVLVGSRSAPRRFTVTNPGALEMPVSVTLTGDFVMSNGCGSAIPARSNCVVDVTFAPRQGGDRDGTLSVTDLRAAPAGGTPARGKVLGTATASLHGVGTLAAVLQLPGSIDLGTFVLGSATPLRSTVTLRNTGNAVLTIDSIGISGPFALQNNCPVNLAPGASCDVVVTFVPASDGTFNGTLSVVSNASGGSGAIPVTARAQPRPVPVIRVTPTSIGFGERMVGTTSAAQRVTIRNDGAAAASLGALQITGDFVVSTTCGSTLEPQQSCFADVSLRPVLFGPRGGQLSFTSNADGSPHTVSLVGTGCRPFGVGANRFGTRPSCAP